MKTMRPAVAVLALAGLASVLSCGRAGRPPEKSAAAPVGVRTALVGGGSEAFIDVPGTVEAARTADIASRVSAVVLSMPVEEGAFVKTGELLVRLDDRDLMARLSGV